MLCPATGMRAMPLIETVRILPHRSVRPGRVVVFGDRVNSPASAALPTRL